MNKTHVSISLNFDDEISELLRPIEQDLMRGLGWNADDVSRGKLVANAAFDSSVTLFVRLGGFGADHVAADDEGCRSGLNEEDISLSFVPFRHAICFPVREHEQIIMKIGQLAGAKVLRAGGCFGL